MALLTKSIKGTQDVLPSESHINQYIEKTARMTAELFGYKEVRTPVFEHTELFSRGVGDTTDVVQKEMYTFLDKGDRSITLRPEGTAGVVRMFLEHGLFNEPMPQKLFYLTSCYRYEKPQAGRLREFHQFGVECFGSASPVADGEVISLAKSFLDELGVENLKLQINSIGCHECRKDYQNALKEYFSAHIDELCDTCKSRLERNPMRILDCKSPVCSSIATNAPKITDYLCDECQSHFKLVQKYLDEVGIEYSVNPNIVRGLDYYTRTVFEFVSDSIGAQGTVCGGGRYDALVEELGGPHTPALGFGLGIERLILLLKAQKAFIPQAPVTDIYIASIGENALMFAAKLASELRENGINAEMDIVGRSIKAQMKYANKTKAIFSLCIGDGELESGIVTLKNMQSGESYEYKFENAEDLGGHIASRYITSMYENVFESEEESDD